MQWFWRRSRLKEKVDRRTDDGQWTLYHPISSPVS